MIIYRKEPYPIQMKNVILLEDKSGNIIYVSKNTYDQALLMMGRLDGNPQRVYDMVKPAGFNPIQELIKDKVVHEAMNTMPAPLNMIAPFLALAFNNPGIDWDVNNREMMYGVLHQYSMMIDFNATILVPAEVRANVVIPTSILMDYKTSWETLCSTLEDHTIVSYAQPAPAPVVVQQVPVAPVQQTPVVPAPQPVVSQPIAPQPTAEQSGETEQERKMREFAERMEREAEEERKAREAKKAKREAERAKAKEETVKPATSAPTANSVLAEYDFD